MNKLYLKTLKGFHIRLFCEDQVDEGSYDKEEIFYSSIKKIYVTKHKINVEKEVLDEIFNNYFSFFQTNSMYLIIDDNMIHSDLIKSELFNEDFFNKIYHSNISIEEYKNNSWIAFINPYILLSDEELFYFHLKYSDLLKDNNEN